MDEEWLHNLVERKCFQYEIPVVQGRIFIEEIIGEYKCHTNQSKNRKKKDRRQRKRSEDQKPKIVHGKLRPPRKDLLPFDMLQSIPLLGKMTNMQ